MLKWWETGKKIVAIGRNFAQHAKELGNQVPTSPVFFLKPTTSYLKMGSLIDIPSNCEVHHEVELGVVIGKLGRNVPENTAMDYVAGYTVAIDLTARNLQDIAKKGGLPWTESKGYDTFCPIGNLLSKNLVPSPQSIELWLKVNGQLKQKGSTKQMIFSIPKLIAHVSSIMTLEPGDLILTGTPDGVGKVVPGDVIEAGITSVPSSEIKFEARARPAKL